MSRNQQYFPMRGGLDQETPAIAIPAGRAIAAINHEAVPLGYARTEGYERFDGRTAPSEVVSYTVPFVSGRWRPAIGSHLMGQISGADSIVLGDTGSSAQWNIHKATGTFYLANITGTYVPDEIVGTINVATFVGVPVEDDPTDPVGLANIINAREYFRGLITEVPGSGPVRGLVWFNDKLHAWRDDAGATKCQPYHSDPDGWTLTDLGYYVGFTNGGPYEIKPGDTIVGAGSAGTATVRSVALDSGDWADSDAAGILIVTPVSGTLGAETLNVGINLGIADIAATPVPMTFPPGGRYEFDIHNFYAASDTERVYGANGVGPAFDFDGVNAAPIATGLPPELNMPFLVKEHKDHLFLGFPFGSLEHSELGSPRGWSGTFGAAELGLGADLTNLITTETMLLVTTVKSISMLTGNDSSDWLLQPVSKDAGAIAHTTQRVGDVVYLDHRGLRSVASAQTYGNFKLGAFTTLISKLLDNKRKAGITPVASCVIKTKAQYLLFFDDGSGVSVFFGVKQPEAMPFLYPFVVSCVTVAEVGGVERVFVGATNGFVYELNKGTSFDGAEIEAYIQLAFNHHGAPRILKRWHDLELEMYGDVGTTIGCIPQFDGGSGEQPLSEQLDIDVEGGGGLWGIATWGEFVWSSPQIGNANIFLDGCGFNMSPILVSRSNAISSYTIAGATVVFSGRGAKR